MRSQAVVGAFVLGGILLGLAAIALFGNLSLFHRSLQAVVVFEGSISGLSVGAPVTFRGVRVGAVENIEIEVDPKTEVAYIPVILRLISNPRPGVRQTAEGLIDLPALIDRGLRAELNLQSFVTGQSQIDLDVSPSVPPVLHPDITSLPEIPVKQSTLQRATEQLGRLPLHELAEDTVATLNSLRVLAEKLDRDLPPLVQSVKTTAEHTTQTVDIAGQAVKDLQGRLDTTLDAFAQVARTGDLQLTQRGADLHTLLAASDQTMRQVRELLADVKGLTAERSGSRANLESTLRDLAAAAASLRGFANDVEHDPQLLLTGRKP
jgi:paraquat-inducible protein B